MGLSISYQIITEKHLGKIECQQAIHFSVLQPRHTWSNPTWIMKSGVTIYIAQAITLDEAVALVKEQYPHVGELEVVKVGGVLAPNQVVAVDVFGEESH